MCLFVVQPPPFPVRLSSLSHSFWDIFYYYYSSSSKLPQEKSCAPWFTMTICFISVLSVEGIISVASFQGWGAASVFEGERERERECWARVCARSLSPPVIGERREGAEPRRRDCNAIAGRLKRAITHTHTCTLHTRRQLKTHAGVGAEPHEAERSGAAGGAMTDLFTFYLYFLLFSSFCASVQKLPLTLGLGFTGKLRA